MKQVTALCRPAWGPRGRRFKSCRPDGEKRRSEHLRFFVEDHFTRLLSHGLSQRAELACLHGVAEAAPADLTGIRQRGSWFQVRVFGGTDSATGR